MFCARLIRAKTSAVLLLLFKYNHYFTETLQKLRNERNQNEYFKIIKQFFGVTSLEASHYCGRNHQLVAALVQRTEPDMNRFACSEALDCMEAHYKVDPLFYPAPTSIISLNNPIV